MKARVQIRITPVDSVVLRELKARESIRECVYLYALAGDRGNDPGILRQIFSTDAKFEAAGMAKFDGREAIIKGLGDLAKSEILWSFHVPGGPLMRLTDEATRADVFWWVWCPVRVRNKDNSSTPVWGAIQYNGELFEEEGNWQFSKVLLEIRLRTAFDGPWTEISDNVTWPEWALTMRDKD